MTNYESSLPTLFNPRSSEYFLGFRIQVPSYSEEGELLEIVSPARLRFMSDETCEPTDQPLWTGSGLWSVSSWVIIAGISRVCFVLTRWLPPGGISLYPRLI